MANTARLLSHAGNYRRVFQGRGSRKRLVAILFNSKRHIVGGNGIMGSAVDASRAKQFLSTLDGVIARTMTVAELAFEVLSLHCVTVKVEDRIEPYVLMPVWSMDDMQQVRRTVSCSCGGFVRSEWVCSHILATLSIQRLANLEVAMSCIASRRLLQLRPPSPTLHQAAWLPTGMANCG
jgi:hypothetical protein